MDGYYSSCRISASYIRVSRTESFVIVDTYVGGTIPTTLGNLASIGTFLATLSNYAISVLTCIFAEVLFLHQNFLTSTIPTELSKLSTIGKCAAILHSRL